MSINWLICGYFAVMTLCVRMILLVVKVLQGNHCRAQDDHGYNIHLLVHFF